MTYKAKCTLGIVSFIIGIITVLSLVVFVKHKA